MSDLSPAKYFFGSAILGGLVYAVGGYEIFQAADVESYNPVSDTWALVASMSSVRSGPAVSALGGLLYAMGGGCGVNCISNTVESYNPAANVWSNETVMLEHRYGLASVVCGGVLYAIGGRKTGSIYDTLSSVESGKLVASSDNTPVNGGPLVKLDRNSYDPEDGGSLAIRIFPGNDDPIRVRVFTGSAHFVREITGIAPDLGGWKLALWDGKDGDEKMVARGVYLIHVEGSGFREILKVVVK